ncbi:MAG: c-type cytochrome [Bacteroidetes bacterium]|nr:c-type cytochrome [Bacteroidota bacterium]
MKSKIIQLSILTASLSVAFLSCKREMKVNQADKLPKQDVFASDYNEIVNNKITQNVLQKATVDNDMAALGRLLFYDSRLSLTGTISCASCHKQEIGFADNVAFSVGFTGKQTGMNALAISNLNSDNVLFWRNRANTLEKLSLMPVANHIEMGFLSLDEVVKNINRIPFYQETFNKVFQSEANQNNISKAMGQFLRSMQSANSKYDQGFATTTTANFSNFSDMENYGKQLFFTTYNCASCHGVPSKIQSGWSEIMSNIGLDPEGKGSGDSMGGFKVPSLRNIALTAPYMHDGRFNSLSEVIDHYSAGIQMNQSLSWQLRETDPNSGQSRPKKFNIPDTDKTALIAFLRTLTDNSYLHDKRFSNPFVQ